MRNIVLASSLAAAMALGPPGAALAQGGYTMAEPEVRPGDASMTCAQIGVEMQALMNESGFRAGAAQTKQGTADISETLAAEGARNRAEQAANAPLDALALSQCGPVCVAAARESSRRARVSAKKAEKANAQLGDNFAGMMGGVNASYNTPRFVALSQLIEAKQCSEQDMPGR